MTELRRAHVFCKTTGSQEMGRESEYEQNMLSYSSHTYQLGISSHLSRSSICKEDRKNNNGAPKETQSEEKEFFMNSGVLKSVTQPLRPSICSSKKKGHFNISQDLTLGLLQVLEFRSCLGLIMGKSSSNVSYKILVNT